MSVRKEALVQVAHAVVPEFTLKQGNRRAVELGCSPELGYADLVRRRHEGIVREREYPLEFGLEPPDWWLCDCLLGFPWVPQDEAAELRRVLGFDGALRTLLILGGNRAGKSEYAAKRMSRLLWLRNDSRVWLLHSTESMSRQYQQPLMHKYLPPELRFLKKPLQTQKAYVSYKQQTGFSDKHFVLPNGSECSFLCYEMDRKHVEGGNVDGINPDELVPPDWVETMELRLAERQGKMIVTFTPVDGFSGTVAMFLNGAEVTKWSTAFLLPKDGKEARPDLECGLMPDEYEAMNAWMQGGPGRSVWARPEDCRKWKTGWLKGGRPARAENEGQMGVPEGREFELTPRVARCAANEKERGLRGVVWFKSSGNPYGNPVSVYQVVRGRSMVFLRERFYGVADKVASVKFPLFDENVHCFEPGEEPTQGTWWMYVDPCGGRNWFMLWVLSTPEEDWVVEEWPSQVDPIPGTGVIGPWAIPDGKLVDGRPGEGQKTLGWGLVQYKAEIARIEKWKNGKDGKDGRGKEKTEMEIVREWEDPVCGGTKAGRRVFERVIDSRFSGARMVGEDRIVTLLEELQDVGLMFVPATAVGSSSDGKTPIGEGIQLVNDALYFDREKPVGFGNRPRLRVSRKCKNLIFALKTWTNASEKSATKDCVDVLRMHYQHGGCYVDQEGLNVVTGGGHW